MMSTSPLLGLGKWLPKSCNNTNGFICNRDLGEFLPLLLVKEKNNNVIMIIKKPIKQTPHTVKQKQHDSILTLPLKF